MRWSNIALIAAWVTLLCCILRDCGRDEPVGYEPPRMDTLVYVDTVRYYMPVARDSVVVRYATARLPRVSPPLPRTDSLIRGDSLIASVADSVDVELPITQVHYADSAYRAWVSGFMPRLDSIEVYPRREVITAVVKEPPKRWHIGVQAGIGIAPPGVQPYIGIGVTYSFFDI